MTRLVLFLCLCLSVPASLLHAATPDCETLAIEASQRYGVPEGLLIAIARTESGIARGAADLRAWPWTANVQGKSHYYDTRQEMLTHLGRVVAEDISNFDVGCMQLNYRWHGDHFASLDRMLDPESNVAYAARYLSQLHDETGSWDGATRYYHSRDPKRGAAYLDRVREMHAALETPAGTLDQVVTLSTRNVPDRQSPSSRPVVDRLELRSYWEGVNLAEGNLPTMPGRP
jgi:hypothetical protein